MSDFHIFKALKIKQPFGDYFSCKIPADILRELSYSFEATNTGGNVEGVQRFLRKDRLIDIAKFIDSESAAFPNPIILAANYLPSGRLEEEENRCTFKEIDSDFDLYEIQIPKKSKILSIIDGQHRLFAFDYAKHKDMDLVCSIYFDLPTPYQAYLFSTINFNQGKVDKSLAYQLFGYELDSKDSKLWPPETLAVYFARLFHADGPLKGRVRYRTSDEKNNPVKVDWAFSTAAVVEAIISLISRNPKDDRYTMNQRDIIDIKGRSALKPDSNFPLRDLYISNNDKAIEEVIQYTLGAVDKIFWSKEGTENSAMRKTIGFMALFKFLKFVLNEHGVSKKTMSEIFPNLLEKSENTDFSDDTQFPASTKGMNVIYNKLIENSKID
jgi:DNA phosphorothioation-associated DGQHR protein 1